MSTKSDFERKTFCVKIAVDLLVRSWVEIDLCDDMKEVSQRRPPCEVVSWNANADLPIDFNCCRPPCEVVSWNVISLVALAPWHRRPPCEVVSWNNDVHRNNYSIARSTSLWGRELKYIRCIRSGRNYSVDLLVRSWVEIPLMLQFLHQRSCRPPCEVVSWNTRFRMIWTPSVSRPPCEVVSWNEWRTLSGFRSFRRPPCEVVSWNLHFSGMSSSSAASTSLWGRELKYVWLEQPPLLPGRPPCEVVSWNIAIGDDMSEKASRPPCEVVSWNVHRSDIFTQTSVDLLVRSWVEIAHLVVWFGFLMVSTSLRGRELKWHLSGTNGCCRWSTSSRGRELKWWFTDELRSI